MISRTDNPFDMEALLDQLGDKVTGAVAAAVVEVRADLALYRAEHPGWASSDSERGLANWINDRLWDHLVRLLDGVDVVAIGERGSTRELIVRDRIRIRVKRHDMNGAIATYPTRTALSFYKQSCQLVLFDGLPEVYLAVGYVWERESREIGVPVVSLRDGVDNLVWMHELPQPPMESVVSMPPVSDAPAPTVVAREETEPRSAKES
jgi:hypothetical protein